MPESFDSAELWLRLQAALEEYRERLTGSLDGLSEEEARRSLVPSKTTLLGLVKHLTYVERFYFEHCVTGRSLKELGIASTPDRSFVLAKRDTIESVRDGYRRACEAARETVAALGPTAVVHGRGEQPVWSLHLRVLQDVAQHCGHADILREQLLATRTSS